MRLNPPAGQQWPQRLADAAAVAAVLGLGLVVGVLAGQVLHGPFPDEVQASFTPDRIARSGPPGPAELVGRLPPPEVREVVDEVEELPPPATSAATSEAITVSRRRPGRADRISGELTAELVGSRGGQGALAWVPAAGIRARVDIQSVVFVPEPAPAVERGAAAAVATRSRVVQRGPITLVATAQAPESRFSADADADGWRRLRASLADGRLPPRGSVPIEDLVNAQASDAPLPAPGELVGFDVEVAPHPWQAGLHLMRVALRAPSAQPAAGADLPPRELTVLVDTSGSMALDGRLDAVVAGLQAMAEGLRPGDRLTLIPFSNEARVAVDGAGPDQLGALFTALSELHADGASAGLPALSLGLQRAVDAALPGVEDRVVLITDGEANVGMSGVAAARAELAAARNAGVRLDVVAVGPTETKTTPLAGFVAVADGRLWELSSVDDTRDLLGRQLLGQPEPVPERLDARVRFDPELVTGWRLLGHERAVGVDALPPLQLRPSQVVTALYEVALAPAVVGAALDRSLAEIRVAAFGDGDRVSVRRVSRRLVAGSFDGASADLRMALAAASLGTLLDRRELQIDPWLQTVELFNPAPGRPEQLRPQDVRLRKVIRQVYRLLSRDGPPLSVEPGPDVGAPREAASKRDQALLAERLLQVQDSLSPCAERRGVTGHVDLQLTLDAGRVAGAEVVHDGHDHRVERCMQTVARRWSFPSTWTAEIAVPLALVARDADEVGG